ncbi:GAF domain-containing protein [Anabaena sphaerica FACHB-251]|uniref:GAF domain-containing protein n=2 Tax=Anabaena TaxID=1163 RepID=A0A926WHL2_9NOST|nr:GAF domain-containing protein [Anabaena sphaerica FACHB-251]
MGQPKKPIAAEQQILSLGKILQTLRDEDDVQVLITTTIGYLKKQFDYQFIWLGLYDSVSKKIHGQGGITPDGETSYLKRSVLLNPGNLICQVVTELCPVGVANLRGEVRAPEWQEVAAKYNIQGTIILPIRYKDNCLGVVLLGSQRWGYLLTGDARAKLLIVIGELGVVLDQNQKQRHSQENSNNSTTESLLELLENLRSLTLLDKKLAAAVEAIDQFVSPSRTNIYWFEREGNYFWSRMSSQLVKIGREWNDQRSSVGITAHELSDVYYALAVNQLVWLTESGSSLKSHIQDKLLQRLGVRSLLAAPIIWQKDLLGFISVETSEPRIWSQADKSFVQGAAGLLSLVIPTENLENTIGQIQQNHQLTNKFSQAIHKKQDLQQILHPCAVELLERLAATRFLLLEYDQGRDIYQVIYQGVLHNRRFFKFTPTPLSEMDFNLLQNAKDAIEIATLEHDLRLFSWHPQLLDNGVRSLLICNCIQGDKPEVLLVITHESSHSWTTLQKELCWVVSQCLGVIVRNHQLNAISEEQQKIAQLFKEYPNTLIKSESENTESIALKQIADVLECPLSIVLTWNLGEERAKVIRGVINNHHFGIVADVPIFVERDILIELALAHSSYVIFKAYDVPPETKKWLTIPENGQVLVMALRTTDDSQPTGVVLLADYEGAYWSELNLNATVTLISQLAWWQSQNKITQRLTDKTEVLRDLNWYKHRRLEEIHRMSASVLTQIRDLGIPSNELKQMRYKLLLRQLNYITNSMTGVIKQEQWQLHLSWETMSVASLLKRTIERVDNFAKQQQLWIGVHGLTQPTEEAESPKSTSLSGELITAAGSFPLATAGDIVKIELVIYELLLSACTRSPIGDRVDIWCQRLDETLLEVSITDNGTIDPQLLALLNENTWKDVLTSTHLNQPPGLHFLICQNLIKQLGGQLQIYQVPDNRVVSRLILPLAPHNFEGNTLGNTLGNTFGNTSPFSQ